MLTITYLVENGVAETDDVNHNLAFEQWKEMIRHTLPEVQEKILDLQEETIVLYLHNSLTRTDLKYLDISSFARSATPRGLRERLRASL